MHINVNLVSWKSKPNLWASQNNKSQFSPYCENHEIEVEIKVDMMWTGSVPLRSSIAGFHQLIGSEEGTGSWGLCHITRQVYWWIQVLVALLGSGRTKDIGASLEDVGHHEMPCERNCCPQSLLFCCFLTTTNHSALSHPTCHDFFSSARSWSNGDSWPWPKLSKSELFSLQKLEWDVLSQGKAGTKVFIRWTFSSLRIA